MRWITTMGAAALASAALAAPAQGALGCGDTITQDQKLHADLVDCPATALTIDGDDITLKMNGHSIDGTGDGGIDIIFGSSDVHIVGGSIRDTANWGIRAEASHSLRLRDLRVLNPGTRGIQVNDSFFARLRRITVSRAVGSSVYVSGQSQYGSVIDSRVKLGEGTGIELSPIGEFGVTDSTLLGTGTDASGIEVHGGTGYRFYNLELEGWGGSGLAYFGDGQTFVSGVASGHNTNGFLVDGEGISLRHGVSATQNDEDGLHVLGTSDHVKAFFKARFNRNGDDGIEFTDGATGALRDSRANNNYDTGILLPATGVTDLGGNSATGNGVTDCVNINC